MVERAGSATALEPSPEDWIEFQIGFEPFEFISILRTEVQAVIGDKPGEVWLLLRGGRNVQIKQTRDQAIARLTR